jgi:hypothetical protein
VASALLLALLAIPNLQVADRDPNYQFTLANFGVNGANFTHTEPTLTVWGSVLGLGATDAMRNAVFPGVVLLALAAVGAVHGWRTGARRRLVTVMSGALVVVGAILAIGTSATGWRRYAPYRLLYELVPPFDALRATARAWMIGLLGLGVLAGLGASALAAWATRHARSRRALVPAVVGVLVVVLILVEGLDPWSDRPNVHVPPVDRALTQRAPGGVVYLPMNVSDQVDIGYFTQPRNLYGATAHHRRTPNGYAGYLPVSYLRQSKELRSLPDPASLALLHRLGVRYVVVHPSVAGTPWSALRRRSAAEPLRYRGRYGRDLLYEVPARA